MAVTPLNAANLNNPATVFVDGRVGYYDVCAYGAVGDDTANDTTPITNAIAAASAAGGGVVFFPSGTYKITTSITISDGVSLLGSGVRHTTLHWPTDLTATPGAAVYGMTQAGSSWTQSDVVRGLLFKGPGTSTTHGIVPANMSGLLMCAGGWVDHCRFTGWYAGIVNKENHEYISNSSTTHNYIGVRRRAGASGGDQAFHNCVFDNDNFANWEIDGDSEYSGIDVINSHFANSPFCIHGATDLGKQLLLDSTFVDVGFEGYNNGIIYGPANRGCDAVAFINCADSSGFTGALAGNPADYAIDCYNFLNFFSSNSFPLGVGAKGVIRALGAISGWWLKADTAYTAADAAAKPLLSAGDTLGFRARMNDQEFIALQPTANSGTIVKNDLLAVRFDKQCQRNSGAGSNGFPLGVALQPDLSATFTGALIPVAQRGNTSISTSDATLNSGGPYWLKPDTVNAGKVVAAASASDLPIVGVTHTAASAGKVLARLKGFA